MKSLHPSYTLFLAAVALLLASSQAYAATPESGIYLLTETGQLATTTVGALDIGSATTLTGVVAGETLVAIDVRPVNQRLYALGINATNDTGTLYCISPQTSVATPVGPVGQIALTNAGAVDFPDADSGWEMDFNPNFDRLRVATVVGSLNFRVNPNSGGPVDGGAGAGVNPDGSINGASTTAGALAHTNNSPTNPGVTTLYALDASTNSLFVHQGTTGTLSQGVALEIRGAPFDFSAVRGFDIEPGVDTTATNAPVASGVGYAILTTSSGTGFYEINLATGQPVLRKALTGVRSMALALNTPAAIALESFNKLVRFSPAMPQSFRDVSVSGLPGTELLAAIDLRPTTGQLYGLAVNTNTGESCTLYSIDPVTGAATIVGGSGQIRFVNAAGAPTVFGHPNIGYDMDFDPVFDRIRVVNSQGENFRINPTTGLPIDGNLFNGISPPAGTNQDGTTVGLHAIAFTNNFAGAEASSAYVIAGGTTTLHIMNPPNSGTVTLERPLTWADGEPLNLSSVLGFDIAPDVVTQASGVAVASGSGWLTLETDGGQSLLRVNLVTGVVTRISILAPRWESLVMLHAPATPILDQPAFSSLMVGQTLTYQLQKLPGTTVSVRGLPPGLKYVSSTGLITGRVTTPGAYVVVFSAKGTNGSTVTYLTSMIVQALSPTAVGTFVGHVENEGAVNGNTGGRLDLTVSSTGAYTLKVANGLTSLTKKGFLTLEQGQPPEVAETLADGSMVELSLQSNTMTGNVSKAGSLASVQGWRRVYDKTINPAASAVGYYALTMPLNSNFNDPKVPQGIGYLTATISADGTVKYTGKTADGIGVTTSSFLGAMGQTLVYQSLNSRQGSVSGVITYSPDLQGNFRLNDLFGLLFWTKPATTGRTYPDDFTNVRLLADGDYLSTRSSGTTVLGLPPEGTQFTLDFGGAGLSASAINPDVVDQVAYSHATLKALLPAAGSALNPGRTTLTINSATGLITGGFTLQDGPLKRTVKFQGVLDQGTGGVYARGFFLLAQIPGIGQTASTSPILSGSLSLGD